MPLRAAAICGLLAPVTFVAGLLFGDLAQPDAVTGFTDLSPGERERRLGHDIDARQCERLDLPEIRPPADLFAALADSAWPMNDASSTSL